MPKGIVYKLDFASGKSYIGITTRRLDLRLLQHQKAAEEKAGQRGFAVHRAWKKYGPPQVFVVTTCDGEELKQAERDAIVEYNTLSPDGYNLTAGGDLPAWSEETRQRMSKAQKERLPRSEETRRLISAFQKGRPKPESAKAKMSEAWNTRAPASEETREKLSAVWKGRKQSEEHKANKAKANTGKVRSDEFRAKMSELAKGRGMSDEHKQKISEANKRRGITPEHREKINAALRKRKAERES